MTSVSCSVSHALFVSCWNPSPHINRVQQMPYTIGSTTRRKHRTLNVERRRDWLRYWSVVLPQRYPARVPLLLLLYRRSRPHPATEPTQIPPLRHRTDSNRRPLFPFSCAPDKSVPGKNLARTIPTTQHQPPLFFLLGPTVLIVSLFLFASGEYSRHIDRTAITVSRPKVEWQKKRYIAIEY